MIHMLLRAYLACIGCVAAVATILLAPSSAYGASVDLTAYYMKYLTVGEESPSPAIPRTDYPPEVTGTLLRPFPLSYPHDITRFVAMKATSGGRVQVWGPSLATRLFGPCRSGAMTELPPDIVSGRAMSEVNDWRWSFDLRNAYCLPPAAWGANDPLPVPLSPIAWTLEDKITFNAPVRRKALDGGEFDASPMVIERAGAPWITYYWGYKLGLVESQSDWNDGNRSKMPADWPVFPTAEDNFKLTTLPPPWVEGEVTEYVNTADFPRQPDGQYFYAATDADRTALDSIATWRRTGNSFKQGGYVSVCRFYGGANGGPNTHFYSASDTECNWLKGVSFLAYEGQTFRVNKPLPLAANAAAGTQPSCPAGSKPLYRLYNNASAPGKNYVSNHRYVTSRTTVDAAVAIGWLDEGVSMCVPE